MNKIKAIIFDWGGVCCKEGEPFASKALQKKLKLNPDQIAEKVSNIYTGYYVGKYDKDPFWRSVINFFNLKEDSEINPETLSGAYLNSYEVYDDILDLILKLKKEYKIGLLSNLTPEMKNRIVSAHNLEKYFDAMVFSCDNNAASMKPDNKPYEVILEKLGLKAGQCLFIDNSFKNVEAAEKIGMKTLFFTDKNKFFKDISDMLFI